MRGLREGLRGLMWLALSVATAAGAQAPASAPLRPLCQRTAGPAVHLTFVGDLMLVDGPGASCVRGRIPLPPWRL